MNENLNLFLNVMAVNMSRIDNENYPTVAEARKDLDESLDEDPEMLDLFSSTVDHFVIELRSK